MIVEYGADACRAYILFMAPPDKELLWNEDGLAGVYKFLNRAWRIVNDLAGVADDATLFQKNVGEEKGAELAKTLMRERHRVVGKVTDDFGRNNFNTAISAVMELCNAAGDYLRGVDAQTRKSCENLSALDAEVASVIVKLLAPIVPHWAEELYRGVLGNEESVHLSAWPTWDPEKAKADEVEIAVQVCGKVRAKLVVSASATEDEFKQAALAAVAKDIEGKNVMKVIVVPGRLVNVVAK